MRTIGRPGKNICTLSSHRATRQYAHRAPIGASYEGSSMRLYSACLCMCVRGRGERGR